MSNKRAFGTNFLPFFCFAFRCFLLVPECAGRHIKNIVTLRVQRRVRASKKPLSDLCRSCIKIPLWNRTHGLFIAAPRVWACMSVVCAGGTLLQLYLTHHWQWITKTERETGWGWDTKSNTEEKQRSELCRNSDGRANLSTAVIKLTCVYVSTIISCHFLVLLYYVEYEWGMNGLLVNYLIERKKKISWSQVFTHFFEWFHLF